LQQLAKPLPCSDRPELVFKTMTCSIESASVSVQSTEVMTSGPAGGFDDDVVGRGHGIDVVARIADQRAGAAAALRLSSSCP
jgi:hypothetical protein